MQKKTHKSHPLMRSLYLCSYIIRNITCSNSEQITVGTHVQGWHVHQTLHTEVVHLYVHETELRTQYCLLTFFVHFVPTHLPHWNTAEKAHSHCPMLVEPNSSLTVNPTSITPISSFVSRSESDQFLITLS